jgi:Spy/CpxP family protein refolding chaperone
MENQNLTPQPAGGGHCGRGSRHGFRFGKLLFVVAVAAAAGFAGSYASKSFGMGPFGHHAAMGGPMGAAADPAKMDEHVERMVKHFAVETDATPEQREKLGTIAKDLARDMAPLREKLRTARTQGMALLAAPTIDRAAIEKLRAEQITLADASSKRMTQALADAGEVLNPEQRKKLAERMQKMGERRGGMHG